MKKDNYKKRNNFKKFIRKKSKKEIQSQREEQAN